MNHQYFISLIYLFHFGNQIIFLTRPTLIAITFFTVFDLQTWFKVLSPAYSTLYCMLYICITLYNDRRQAQEYKIVIFISLPKIAYVMNMTVTKHDGDEAQNKHVYIYITQGCNPNQRTKCKPLINTQDEIRNNKCTLTRKPRQQSTDPHKTNGHGTIINKDNGERRAHIYTY